MANDNNSGKPRKYSENLIPQGMELALKKAAVDSAFRARLLEQRGEAADEIGIPLDASERAMLAGIPAGQMQAIISKIKIPPDQKKVFSGTSVAAMMALMAQMAFAPVAGRAQESTLATESDVLGSEMENLPELTHDPFRPIRKMGGIRPDLLPNREGPMKPGGIRPDLAPDNGGEISRGIRPGPPPQSPQPQPLKVEVVGIMGKEGDRNALIVFEGQKHLVTKNFEIPGKLKIVEIEADRVFVYSVSENMRREFPISGGANAPVAPLGDPAKTPQDGVRLIGIAGKPGEYSALLKSSAKSMSLTVGKTLHNQFTVIGITANSITLKRISDGLIKTFAINERIGFDSPKE